MPSSYARIEERVREVLSKKLKTSLKPKELVVTKDGKRYSFDGVSKPTSIIVMIKATGHPRNGKPSKLNLTKQGDLVRNTDVLMAAKRRYHARRAILALSEERTFDWFMGKVQIRNERPVVFGQLAEEQKGVEVIHVPI